MESGWAAYGRGDGRSRPTCDEDPCHKVPDRFRERARYRADVMTLLHDVAGKFPFDCMLNRVVGVLSAGRRHHQAIEHAVGQDAPQEEKRPRQPPAVVARGGAPGAKRFDDQVADHLRRRVRAEARLGSA